MALEQGTADVTGRSTRHLSDEVKRQRALRRASSRLANLHPHEWRVLLDAALKEEGLTN